MKMWQGVGTVAITGLLLAVGCATTPTVGDEERAEDRPEQEESLTVELNSLLVEPAWVEERLGHPDLVVVHVGMDQDGWETGHIPGQVYLNFEEIVVGDFDQGFLLPELEVVREAFEAVGVDDDRSVVLTGDLDGLMATRAFFSLEALGRASGVALLQGGLEQWREDERPISTTASPARPGRLTVHGEAQMVLEAEEVQAILEDPRYQLVDARPGEEFRGESAGAGVARAGHIPGAVNIFWKETIEKEDRALVKPREEIEAIYGEAGVSEDATVVAYCRTGMQASFGYFLGRLQGRDVLIYDGSYIDWASDPERPIVAAEE